MIVRVLLASVLAGCSAASFPIDDTVFRCDDAHKTHAELKERGVELPEEPVDPNWCGDGT